MGKPKDSEDAEVKDAKADGAVDMSVTGPPELSEEDKQRIETELTVKSVTAAEDEDSAGEVRADISSDDEDAANKDSKDDEESKAAYSMVDSDTESEPDRSKADEDTADEPTGKPHGHRLRRFFGGYWHRKRWTIPLTVLIILGALAAVPYTRYYLAGFVLKHQVTISVVDSSTKKPVSSATVAIDGTTYKTDKDGKVVAAKVKVGKHTLAVDKKYYKAASDSLFVPLMKDMKQEISIQATGRQVPVTVVDKITQKPLEDVTLKASGTEVKTDKDGKAVIVLPAEKTDLEITLTNGGYNSQQARVKITDAVVSENTFAMVPAGKVYFLSRQSGKIDVVKTDLDGANRETVVYGTGKEDDQGTVLLASRDWKYLALLSRRDSGLAKLYLIDTSNDKMTVMDEGDAYFSLSGWSGHNFVFNISRNNLQSTDPNRLAVKKFDADKRQLITVDQSAADKIDATTTVYQQYSNFYLMGNELAYIVYWNPVYSGYYNPSMMNGRTNVIRVVNLTDGTKKDVKSFPAEQSPSFYARLYAPGELYVGTYSAADKKIIYFEYEDGKVESAANVDENDFFNADVYPTYLVSPDGNKTFWSEQRDGRDTFFVGDAKGQNGKQIGAWEDYKVYGWYSDSYVLVSKGGSELYILPVAGGTPLKVADYHKPRLSYDGYGGGYGGL